MCEINDFFEKQEVPNRLSQPGPTTTPAKLLARKAASTPASGAFVERLGARLPRARVHPHALFGLDA